MLADPYRSPPHEIHAHSFAFRRRFRRFSCGSGHAGDQNRRVGRIVGFAEELDEDVRLCRRGGRPADPDGCC